MTSIINISLDVAFFIIKVTNKWIVRSLFSKCVCRCGGVCGSLFFVVSRVLYRSYTVFPLVLFEALNSLLLGVGGRTLIYIMVYFSQILTRMDSCLICRNTKSFISTLQAHFVESSLNLC